MNNDASFDVGLKSDGADWHCKAKLYAFIFASRCSLARNVLGVCRSKTAVELHAFYVQQDFP
jgi:hypothetical protein